jgi:integrase/recombinase XerD
MKSNAIISLDTIDKRRKKIGEEWDLAIEAFLKNCEARNLRENTLKYYKEVLIKNFLPFVNRIKIQPSCIANEIVQEYILYLKKRNNSVESINTRLRGLRAFLNFLNENQYIDQKIKIKMLRTEHKIIKTFAEEQLKKLLEKPKDTTFALYRDWTIVNFLIGTGVRLGTLIDVKIQNIDFISREINCMHTKNRDELIIPLSIALAKVLRDYLDIRGGEPEDFLFPNEYGEQIAERTVQHRIKRYCVNRLGESTDMRFCPHDFRHTFAIMYIRNSGGDILTLQKLLGHKNLEMTRRYSNMLTGDIKRQFSINSPLDSISNIRSSGRKAIKIKK